MRRRSHENQKICIIVNDADIAFGVRETDNANDYDGLMDEVLIYDWALSSNQVYNLYLYDGTNFPTTSMNVNGDSEFLDGVKYSARLGDVLMGSYTNEP